METIVITACVSGLAGIFLATWAGSPDREKFKKQKDQKNDFVSSQISANDLNNIKHLSYHFKQFRDLVEYFKLEYVPESEKVTPAKYEKIKKRYT